MALYNKKETSFLSIDMTGRVFKFVEAHYSNNSLRIKKMFRAEIEETVFIDGTVKDLVAFSQFLKQNIVENKVTSKNVVITMDSTSIIRRELEVPTVPDEDMQGLVSFELVKYLPINIDENFINYKVLDTYDSYGRSMSKVNVYAISKTLTKSLFDGIKSADLSPLVFDVNDNVMIKLMNFINMKKFLNEETISFIELDERTMSISVYDNKVLKVNRLFDYGIASFESVVEEYEKSKLQGSDVISELFLNEDISSVREFVHAIQLADSVVTSFVVPDSIKSDIIRNATFNQAQFSFVEDVIRKRDIAINDIERVFKYYTSRSSENVIDVVYVYGPGAQNASILEDLSAKLGYKCEKFDIMSYNGAITNETKEDPVKYLNAIGTLLR